MMMIIEVKAYCDDCPGRHAYVVSGRFLTSTTELDLALPLPGAHWCQRGSEEGGEDHAGRGGSRQ